MGGPSKEAKANEKAQFDFYKATTEQQKRIFDQQQDLYKRIIAITAPIIAKGPNQYGFTPEVDALLRQSIIDRAAEEGANVLTATQLAERQKTGGTNVLPTGASAELEENARILSEQSKARQLTNEKLAGYQRGGELYSQAVAQLAGATGNPVAFTGAASGAGREATGAIQLADSERSTLLGSLLGGAIQGGLSLATGFGAKQLGIPLPGCWVARAVYGDDNPLWLVFRARFFSGRYPLLSRLYLRFGEQLAALIKRSRLLRRVFKRLLDRVTYAAA